MRGRGWGGGEKKKKPDGQNSERPTSAPGALSGRWTSNSDGGKRINAEN